MKIVTTAGILATCMYVGTAAAEPPVTPQSPESITPPESTDAPESPPLEPASPEPAPPAVPPEPSRDPSPMRPTPPRSPIGAFASISAGGAYQRALDIPIGAFEAAGLVGAMAKRFGGGVGMTTTIGSTVAGMGIVRLAVSPVFLARIARLRIGGGIHVGWVKFERRTVGPAMSSAMGGVSVQATYDVWSAPPHAVFIGLRSMIERTGVAIFGVGLAVGYRFGA